MRNFLNKATLLLALAGLSLSHPAHTQLVTGTQDFSITVQDTVDQTPDDFTFASVTGVNPSTITQSASVLVTGISEGIPVSITGGEYSINSGPYTSSPGVIGNENTIRVRLTSSPASQGVMSATVIVGTLSRSFSVTTRTLGACEPAGIAIGTNCGGGVVYVGNYAGKRYFMSTPTTITATWSDSVTNVRSRTSSSSGWTNTQGMRQVSSNLSFFNGAGICVSTYGSSFFLPSSDEINAIWSNLSVSLRSTYFRDGNFHMTSEEWGTGKFGQITSTSNNFHYALTPRDGFTTIQWDGRTKTGLSVVKCVRTDINLIADDFDPNEFAFTNQINVEPSTEVTSNTVTITGIVGNAPISVGGSGATFSVSGDPFSSAARTITNGQTVRVRAMSSNVPGSIAGALLTVGSMAREFIVTTTAPSTTPNAFSFTAQAGVQPVTQVISNSITISGLVGPAPVSVSGGAAYSINGGGFTTGSGSISNGDSLRVQLISSGTLGGNVTGGVTVGTVTVSFSVTTTSQDTTPEAFTFTTTENRTSAERSTLVTFSPVTISGVNTPVQVSVGGAGSPQVRVNTGAWGSSGTVSNGDVVAFRMTSSDLFGTTREATLTAGLFSTPVSVTTRAGDATPNTVTFPTLTGQEPNVTVTSATVTPTGYEQATIIPSSGLSASVGGGAFSTAAQTINVGQSITLQATSPGVSGSGDFFLNFRNSAGAPVYTTVWTVSSRPPIGPTNTAMPWSYGDWLNSAPTITSSSLTLSGTFSNARVLTSMSPPSGTYTLGGCFPSIFINGVQHDRCALNAGTITVKSGDVIQMRTMLANFTQNVEYTFTLGEVDVKWCVTDSSVYSVTYPDPRPGNGLSVPGCPQP